MPFLLKIVFTGLIAFVPRTNAADDRVGIDVLLIDGRQGRVASDYVPVLPHYPILRYRVADLGDGCRTGTGVCERPDFWFQYSSPDGELREVVVLDGLDITLTSNGKSADYKEVNCDVIGDARHNIDPNKLREPCSFESSTFPELKLNNFNDFDLVLRLSRIAGAAGGEVDKIDSDCLEETGPARDCDQLIAARLHFDGGLVMAGEPSQNTDNSIRAWISETLRNMGGPDPGGKLFFAGSVEIYFSFEDGESVLFQERQFGQSSVTESYLQLFPNSDSRIGNNRVVEVVVENIPVSDLFGDPPGQDPRLEPLRHAEAHYDLAENKRPLHLRPVPTRVRKGNGLSEASTVRCEPETQFASEPISASSLFYRLTDKKKKEGGK